MTDELKSAPGEVHRESKSTPGQKLLWCPFAEIPDQEMKSQGKYPKGYPEGCIVHFTAGQADKSAVAYGRKMGYSYMHIDPMGVITQSTPLDEWGCHAGDSYWEGLGHGVSQHLVGIEVACAGKLTKIDKQQYQSWFGKKYDEAAVRYFQQDRDNVQAGYYQKYTQAQETALIHLILWLKTNNPDVFKIEYVLGHDEVAPSRKNDPGAALSATMPEFRKLLGVYLERQKAE